MAASPKALVLLGALCGASAFAPAASALSAARRPACSAARLPALKRAAKPAVVMQDAAVVEPPVVEPVVAEVAPPEPKEDWVKETLTTGSLFGLWYLFNIANQIYNKRALNALGMPYSIALLQLAVGIPYVAFLWATGLRKAPKLSSADVKTLVPVSLCHLGTHLGAVVSLSAGAVSFTHIVKASEPVVSAALSAAVLGTFYHPITYLTLLPIFGGVALASVKELSFTMLGFVAAMLSNLSSAMRAIIAKKTMTGKQVGENMNEANLYAVITILAFVAPHVETAAFVGAEHATARVSDCDDPRLYLRRAARRGGGRHCQGYRRRLHAKVPRHVLAPLRLLLLPLQRGAAGSLESSPQVPGPTPYRPSWPIKRLALLLQPPERRNGLAGASTGARLAGRRQGADCSVSNHQEVAFLALGRVNPITHAVANTLKRVVIIVASVIAFNTPISPLGVIGSSVAITGTLLYTLAKSKFG